jgi:(S)-2-hydroxyglutarate dehydrogenase
MAEFDVCLIGGGIVGLATAYQVSQKNPELKIAVVEKEASLGEHQTGHNSGVLHSGIYYRPGSLKAINCREGKLAMEEFCAVHEIPFDRCGKVIVAIDESERSRLLDILTRGQKNQVNCRLIDGDELHQLEPHCAGVAAIHVPEAGIVNYRLVCESLGRVLTDRQCRITMGAKVNQVTLRGNETLVGWAGGELTTRLVVNCAGLYCDRVTKLAGAKPPAKIVPFRGEYFELKKDAEHLCRNLIYPVPDPKFPFLGVHFTRMIQGGVECGPNAVLAFAREGYTKTKINIGELCESLTYGGFLRMALKHWKMGAGEMWRSWFKSAFVKALQRLIPEIRAEHLVPAPAGVRAQAVLPDGSLVDDFLLLETVNAIHVLNAPSPAATASLNIGKLIAEKIAARQL